MIRTKLYSVPRLAATVVAMVMTGCPGDDVSTPADGTDSESSGDSSTGGSVSMTTMTNATTMDSVDSSTSDPTTGMDTTEGSTDDGPSACGNNVLEGAEECDLTQLDDQTCATQGFDNGELSCNVDCTFNTDGCGTCGNDMAETAEACDGTDLLGESCVTQGFAGGFLGCAADCSAFDTTTCSDMATCGNDLTELGETCDGTDLAGEDCVSQGFAGGGTLVCAASCLGFDFSMCMGQGGDCCVPNGTPGCENGICEASVCALDPFCCSDTWDDICSAAAFQNPDCFGASASCPTGLEVCGNDMTEITEQCDGMDLSGQDCVSLGFVGGGTLACAADCSFDILGCDTGDCCAVNGSPGCDDPSCEAAVCAIDGFCCDTDWDQACVDTALNLLQCAGVGTCPPPIGMCGNDTVEGLETCDGIDLGGQTCVSIGFVDGGTLACAGDCTGFDVSGCDTGDCCVANGTPGCNVPACEAAICAVDGFCCNTEWDQICADAALFDPACAGVEGCPTGMEMCGNNLAEFGEVCDGTDLDGQDCTSIGIAGGGALACSGDCGSFDASGCNADVSCAEEVGAVPTTMGTNAGGDDDLTESCGAGGVETLVSFTATVAGVHTFDAIGSDYDTVLSAFLDCGGSEIICNDDFGGNPLCGGFECSQLDVNLAVGQTVIISVAGFEGATGNWVLNVTEP